MKKINKEDLLTIIALAGIFFLILCVIPGANTVLCALRVVTLVALGWLLSKNKFFLRRITAFALCLAMIGAFAVPAFASTVRSGLLSPYSEDTAGTDRLTYLRNTLASIVEAYGLYPEMTDDDLAYVYLALDTGEAEKIWANANTLMADSQGLTEEELAILETEANTQVCLRFYNIMSQIRMAIPAVTAFTGEANLPDGLTVSHSSGSGEWKITDGTITNTISVIVDNKGTDCNKDDTYTASESTIRLKSSAPTANLTFTVKAASGSVTINGNNVAKDDVVPITLEQNQEVEIYIKSGASQNSSATLTLEYLYEAENADALSIVFKAEDVPYIVNGDPENNRVEGDTELPMSIDLLTGVTVSPENTTNYALKGAIVTDDNGTILEELSAEGGKLKPTKSGILIPIFYSDENGVLPFRINDKYYWDLDSAIAASGPGTVIIQNDNYTLPAGNYTIPSGVTLLVSFDGATLYTDKPEAKAEYEVLGFHHTLTMAEGANIIVKGAISLSAKHCSTTPWNGMPTGYLSRIHMNQGSTIALESTGKLYAYGYITGAGTIRTVSGAEVYENFQLKDWRGGSQSTDKEMKNHKVFPFSQYYLQNIEVPLTIASGAKLLGYFSVTVSGMVVGTKATVVGTNDGMFKLSSGSITKDYAENTDRLYLEASGATVSMDAYTITIKPEGDGILGGIVGALANYSLNTGDFVFPITNNFSLKFANQSTMNVNTDACLLPGSEIIVDSGSKIVTGTSAKIYIYDADQWGNYTYSTNIPYALLDYAPGRPVGYTRSDFGDAKICLNGSMSGAVYTTAGGANVYSTGTGSITNSASGTATTNQLVMNVVMSGSTAIEGDIFIDIPVTPAQLTNADGSKVISTTNTYNGSSWIGSTCSHSNTTEVSNSATCHATGFAMTQCTNCGAITGYTKTAALNHSSGWEKSNMKVSDITADDVDYLYNQTCDHGNYYYMQCKACKTMNLSMMDDDDQRNAHNYSNKIATVPSTCTTEGYDTYQCSVCGKATENRALAIDANAHSWNTTPASYAENGETCVATYTCIYNGTHTKTGEFSHNYVNHICTNCNHVETFSIKFVNVDGRELKTYRVEYNATPAYDGETPTKAATAEYSYVFKSWTPEITAVTGEATYTATYTEVPNRYTITFDTDGGSAIDAITQDYGTDVTAPDDPTKEGHTFAGWDAEIPATMPAKDMTVKAKWDVNSYTITWIVDGVETPVTVAYGAAITSPEPTKAQEGCTVYNFSSWNAEVPETMPAKDLIFTAVFTESESHAWSNDVDYKWAKVGEDWVCTATRICTRDESHTDTATAIGKDPQVTTPADCKTAEITTITATFDVDWAGAQERKIIGEKDPSKHAGEAVTYNDDGDTHSATYDCCGAEYIAGEDHNYTYDSVNHKCICGDVKKFTITWTVDGKTVYTELLEYNSDIPVKEVPVKEGYTGKWDTTGKVTGAITITAQWEANQHTIYWKNGEGNHATTYVKYGEVIEKPNAPKKDSSVACIKYKFTDWEGYTDGMTMPDNDLTFVAQFEEVIEHKGQYTYTDNDDGTHTGKYACCGADEVTEAHSYKDGKCVCDHDQVITVRFLDEDGKELSAVEVKYGNVPVYGEDVPTKSAEAEEKCVAYEFAGWATVRNGDVLKELPEAKEDAVYYAVFKAVTSHNKSPSWSHDESNHWHICSTCKTIITDTKAGHNFVDGSCSVCGFRQISDLFRIYGTNLKAGDCLDLFFYVNKTDVDGRSGVYAKITRYYNDHKTAPQERIVVFDNWDSYNSTLYRFCYDDISAKEMMDQVSVAIYANDENGVQVQISETFYESVENYAIRSLNAYKVYGQGTRQHAMCVALADMLYYGAAAQQYFGYDPTNLATARLEANNDYKKFATANMPECINRTEDKLGNLLGDSVTASTNMEYNFYFSNITKEMTAYITYTNHYGTSKSWTVNGMDFYTGKNVGDIPVIGVPVKGMAVADGRQLITCVVKDSDGNIHGEATSSIESYVFRQLQTEKAHLFAPLIKFVDSAKVFFAMGN